MVDNRCGSIIDGLRYSIIINNYIIYIILYSSNDTKAKTFATFAFPPALPWDQSKCPDNWGGLISGVNLHIYFGTFRSGQNTGVATFQGS